MGRGREQEAVLWLALPRLFNTRPKSRRAKEAKKQEPLTAIATATGASGGAGATIGAGRLGRGPAPVPPPQHGPPGRTGSDARYRKPHIDDPDDGLHAHNSTVVRCPQGPALRPHDTIQYTLALLSIPLWGLISISPAEAYLFPHRKTPIIQCRPHRFSDVPRTRLPILHRVLHVA